MFTETGLPTSFSTADLSFSISAPFLPMIIPGRAATIVTRSLFTVLSMMMLETPA
jgi:hypothetical protein